MDGTARAGSRAAEAWSTMPGGLRRMCKCLIPEEAFGGCWVMWHSDILAEQNEPLGYL